MKEYNLHHNVYIPSGQHSFGYTDAAAVEDYLLRHLEEESDVSTGSAGLAAAIRDWPTLYHLSPRRADLLRPLSGLLKGKKILEIGSGCGAITRFLGELGCEVVALESSQRRAIISRERCRDQSNVRVVCDDFDDFQWHERFDLVLLVGVLEYSNQFINSSNPPLQMLRRAKEYLDPRGRLILAIENKLGLKYWAGAPEDHTGRPFDGIENKYTTGTAVTFGRMELRSLLDEAGFLNREFLYPFPDHKLPEVIIKEAAFTTPGLNLKDLLHEKFDYPHSNGQATEFSPTRAAASVLDNQLMPDLSNSFLVVAGDESMPADDVLVYTYNSTRKKPYCKSNLFVRAGTGPLQVIRERLYPGGPEPSNAALTQCILDEEYIPGTLLAAGAQDIVTREGWTLDGLAAWAAQYYQVLKQHSAQLGTLSGEYLDLTPFNILITDQGAARPFDQEWQSPDKIPLYFILFRGLVYSLDKIGAYATPAPGTPTGLIPLVMALINIIVSADASLSEDDRQFDASALATCVRLEEKYFGAIPLVPGKPFVHGGIPLERNWKSRYDDLTKKLVEASGTLQMTIRELEQAQRELDGRQTELEEQERIQEWERIAMQEQLSNMTAQLSSAQAAMNKAIKEQTTLRLESEQKATRQAQEQQASIESLHQHLDWYRRTYEERSLPGLLLQRRLSAARTGEKYLTAFLLTNMQEKGTGETMGLVLKTIFSKGWQGLLHPRKTLLPLMRTSGAPAPVAHSIQQKEDPIRAMQQIRGFSSRPRISFIMPVYNTDPRWLERAMESIREQWYDNWELCIADDGSTRQETQRLLKSLEKEEKIKLYRLRKNEGISAASNKALEMAEGDYIALMDHDDELTPDALYQVVKDLNSKGEADILYTDECKVDEEGRLSEPFYKPDYSAELLLNMMYTGHLTVYKRSFLVQKVGGFRTAYDLSQDYDLMLRAVENTSSIRHIEKIVYHWRMTTGSSSQGDKPHARQSNLAALGDAMKRRNIAAEILELPTANRARPKIGTTPLVSIIIPTDSKSNLQATLESIYTNTDYPRFEVVVVTNSGLIADPPASPVIPAATPPPETSPATPGRQSAPLYIPYDKSYNFSDKCNTGATAAHGEILVFFNDDVRPLQNDWLENTIEYLFLPGVGGVSPRLVYEDDSIQYAGMATGVRGLTGTTFHGYPKDSTAYINFVQSVRNVSILSGACLAMRKEVFEEVGGFDSENTPSSHSDVDLSFKILDTGRRCVYTPYATLRHIGHLSLREYDSSPAAREKDKADIYLLRRWAARLAIDPYFTIAMRNHLYHDSPEPYRIYAPDATPLSGSSQPSSSIPKTLTDLLPSRAGDILLVSHDLSISGAPIMLLQLCRILIRNNYFVTVICDSDGPAGKMFLEAGAPLIIDSLLLRQHDTLTRFARNFDHVICNTVVTWPVVRQLSQLTSTIWWLHEAKVLESFIQDPAVRTTLEEAGNVIGPSDYSLQFIKQYNNAAKKLYYGYPDIGTPPDPDGHQYLINGSSTGSETTGRRLILSIIGSIEPRKGQDILIKALQQLDPATKDKLEIWIIGRPHDPEYHRQLKDTIGDPGSKIRFIGECDHDQTLELMRGSDIIICPSRDDPFPVVIVEALCLSKPCIVSSHTGFAELLTHAVNGYIIPNEDSKSLAECITRITDHPETLTAVGAAARQLYQRLLTLDRFGNRFLSLLEPAAANPSARPARTQKTISWQD